MSLNSIVIVRADSSRTPRLSPQATQAATSLPAEGVNDLRDETSGQRKIRTSATRQVICVVARTSPGSARHRAARLSYQVADHIGGSARARRDERESRSVRHSGACPPIDRRIFAPCALTLELG